MIICISGAFGSGKTYIARLIHEYFVPSNTLNTWDIIYDYIDNDNPLGSILKDMSIRKKIKTDDHYRFYLDNYRLHRNKTSGHKLSWYMTEIMRKYDVYDKFINSSIDILSDRIKNSNTVWYIYSNIEHDRIDSDIHVHIDTNGWNIDYVSSYNGLFSDIKSKVIKSEQYIGKMEHFKSSADFVIANNLSHEDFLLEKLSFILR